MKPSNRPRKKPVPPLTVTGLAPMSTTLPRWELELLVPALAKLVATPAAPMPLAEGPDDRRR